MAQARERLSWLPDPAEAVCWHVSEVASVGRGPRYKRPLDLVVGSLIMIVSAPLFVLVALVVKVSSRGPIFFRQERLGLNGRPFEVVKFRSMYANADPTRHREYFKQYLQGRSAPGEPENVFKLRRDPRITPAGRMLRRLGLDELPQLLNVLKGDMSLVGPRPPLEYEVAHYNDRHLARLSVKPGITGWWQVRGRDVVDFESMVELDLEYVRNVSLWLDIKILLMTVPSLVWALVSR